MGQQLQIPACGMETRPDLASSATSGAHGQAEHGQGAAGHQAGLVLPSRRAADRVWGTMRSWGMSSGSS